MNHSPSLNQQNNAQVFRGYSNSELASILKSMGQPVFLGLTREQMIQKILQIRSNKQNTAKNPKRKKIITPFLRSYLFIFIFSFLFFVFFIFFKKSIKINKTKYCNSEVKVDCTKCPNNSNCESGRPICNQDFYLYQSKFCIPSDIYFKQRKQMLDIIIQNLMTTAGNFRTNRSTRDWLSIDEIDSFVYKKVNNIEPRQFDLLLNESLTLLVAESEIIEQHNVNNLRVFASINYRLPFVYRIINSFKRNSMTFCVIMFFTCIIYILTSKHNEEKLIKKKSPHYTSMISEFIRSSKSIAVSETQIKERFSNEIENFQKYWKYIKKELESAQLIRVVNNGTENYYSFIHQ